MNTLQLKEKLEESINIYGVQPVLISMEGVCMEDFTAGSTDTEFWIEEDYL